MLSATSSLAALLVSSWSRFGQSARQAVGDLEVFVDILLSRQNIFIHLNFDSVATGFAVFHGLRDTA